MYQIHLANSFKQEAKKLSREDLEHTMLILDRLAKGEKLEPKYNDHKLSGKLSAYRDCHIKPDLVLIYQKREDILVIRAIHIGKHSSIFK